MFLFITFFKDIYLHLNKCLDLCLCAFGNNGLADKDYILCPTWLVAGDAGNKLVCSVLSIICCHEKPYNTSRNDLFDDVHCVFAFYSSRLKNVSILWASHMDQCNFWVVLYIYVLCHEYTCFLGFNWIPHCLDTWKCFRAHVLLRTFQRIFCTEIADFLPYQYFLYH